MEIGIKQKISRSIIYTYTCHLDGTIADYTLTPQLDEVEWVKFLPLKSVQWLIRKHFLRRFGMMVPTYSYFKRILAATAREMHTNNS